MFMTPRAGGMRGGAAGRFRSIVGGTETRLLANRVVLVGALVTGLLIGLALIDAGGLAAAWQNLHWTAAAITAAIVGLVTWREPSSRTLDVRRYVSIGLVLWLGGQLAWDLAVIRGGAVLPGPADLLWIGIAVPALGAIIAAFRHRTNMAQEIATFIDAGIVFSLIVAVILVGLGSLIEAAAWTQGRLLLGYALLFLGAAGAGLVGALALRAPFGFHGVFAVLVGLAMGGVGFVGWAEASASGMPLEGRPTNIAFSIGVLLAAFGVATWSDLEDRRAGYERTADWLLAGLPIAGSIVAIALLVQGHLLRPDIDRAIQLPAATILGLSIAREGILLNDRRRMLAEVVATRQAAEAALAENDRLVGELGRRMAEMDRVQAGLVAASKRTAVGELAAAVAHEVNNPLTGVLGYAELVIESLAPDDPNRAEVEIIRTEALRARAIVRSLLDFAQPRRQARQSADIVAVVRSTVDLIRYHSERTGVSFVETYTDVPPIEIDPDAIQQALLNLLRNAVQAVERGGELRVDVRPVSGEVAIVIVDDGIGMNEATLARAAEPFFTTRDVAAGVGLGLPVAVGLVEDHGGRIEISSRLGAGTRVEVRLPIGPAWPASNAAEAMVGVAPADIDPDHAAPPATDPAVADPPIVAGPRASGADGR